MVKMQVVKARDPSSLRCSGRQCSCHSEAGFMAEESGVGLGCHSEGRRPEESGVKAFQKQNQVLHSVQNDNQNQVLRRRSGRQKNPVILRPGSWPKNLVVDRSIIRNAIPHAQLVQDENVYSSNPGFFLPKK